MSTTFLTAALTPTEVEKIVNTFSGDGTVITDKFEKEDDDKNYRIEGTVRIDSRNAKAQYALGALKYGPVDTLIIIKDFRVRIDWHRLFKIPKELCLVIKDPCGNVIIKECIHFDLGVTELVLMQNFPIPLRNDIELLDIAFRDKGGDHFALTGDLPIIATLMDLIGPAVIRGALREVKGFVERLIKSIFGDNPLSDLFIELLNKIVNLVDAAIGFVTDITKLSLRPIDELLHILFPEKLEIKLEAEAFPKDLEVVAKTDKLPAATIRIGPPPKVTLVQSGLELEVYQ